MERKQSWFLLPIKCWHFDACFVLDDNPLVAEQLTCIWYLDESTREISDVTECMAVVLTDVTKCRAVQRNQFKTNVQWKITL